MTEDSETATPSVESHPKSPRMVWLDATIEDLVGLNLEEPIIGQTTIDDRQFSDAFNRAAQKSSEDPDAISTTRVYALLAAITGMYFKPKDSNEPFGPMMVLADGRRSPIPADFRPHVGLLAEIANRVTNPALKARLADISWLLDRTKAKSATDAVNSYIEVIQKVMHQELKFRSQKGSSFLTNTTRDYLWRALKIARAIGWDKPESMAARELAIQLRARAVQERALMASNWFCSLDLNFGVSNPAEIAADLESLMSNLPETTSNLAAVDLWKLTAKAYRLAKNEDDKNRCLAEAAEQLIKEADARKGSAMVTAHFLSLAITTLHGIPDKKKRRLELRHQLIDVQSRISEEMATISHESNISEIVESTVGSLRDLSFLDKLFSFSRLATSPDPTKLRSDALAAMEENPLSSLFETSHMDREGKVIHRSGGAGFGNAENESAIQQKIAQVESIRRQIIALGTIEPARDTIVEQHYVSEDIFIGLLQHSVFVPPHLVRTFSYGFTRFFQGDFTAAIYVLTPLLENSLRHVLKSSGYDVTIFDDSNQTQEDRTISSLFEQMRSELNAVFGTAITNDIENTFLSKVGPHLRHAIAHGLLSDSGPLSADAIYACWLIFRLSLIPLLSYRDQFRLNFEG